MTEAYLYSADFYDFMYLFVDYEKDTDIIKEWINKYQSRKYKSILELGCGTGKYLEHFTDEYQITGVDLSEAMIKISRGKFSNGDFHIADMSEFDLHKKFDIITCLNGSIGHVESIEKVEKVIKKIFSHLNDDGILIIEPFTNPSEYPFGDKIYVRNVETENKKLTRHIIQNRQDNMALWDFNFMYTDVNGSKYFNELHKFLMFEPEILSQILTKNNFEVLEIIPNGLWGARTVQIAKKKRT